MELLVTKKKRQQEGKELPCGKKEQPIYCEEPNKIFCGGYVQTEEGTLCQYKEKQQQLKDLYNKEKKEINKPEYNNNK